MAENYDYRAYDRIWRRVSPELNPYPEARAANESETPEAKPCCLGQAGGEPDVLRTYAENELSDARAYACASARTTDPAARRTFRTLAAAERQHAKRLLAVRYLVFGTWAELSAAACPKAEENYAALLRSFYHAEACAAGQYAAAAEKTEDECLKRLFSQMADEETVHAESILQLLTRCTR